MRSTLIACASALRNALSSGGLRVVFGNSHAVFPASQYGLPLSEVCTLSPTCFWIPGTKLLLRSILPASRFASDAALLPLKMSTMYCGFTSSPSALVAHQPSRFCHVNVCCELMPLWYVYGPVPTSFF